MPQQVNGESAHLVLQPAPITPHRRKRSVSEHHLVDHVITYKQFSETEYNVITLIIALFHPQNNTFNASMPILLQGWISASTNKWGKGSSSFTTCSNYAPQTKTICIGTSPSKPCHNVQTVQ